MELLKLLGKRTQQIREDRKLTQEGLENITGTNANYISAIERGAINPTVKTMDKLATGLDVELYELFLFSEPFIAKRSLKKALNALIEESDTKNLALCLQFLRAANG